MANPTCPNFMFGEIRVSNFFKATWGQITDANLKGLGWTCLGEGHLARASCLAEFSSAQHHVVTCPETHLHISFYFLPPGL